MANYNRVDSWYTDSSSYNADEHYGNSPFATDPNTFPAVRNSLSSTAVSQPYAMIPLPSQFQLYTIEEIINQEEDTEPCLTSTQRQVESLAVRNGDLIEKSLKSISLIRSRLLQQQESNRKKSCELQQIRTSLEAVQSLVHLVHDQKCKKTWIEFSTEEFKFSSNMKNLKLTKSEKEGTPFPYGSGERTSIDEIEPLTPTRVAVSSHAQTDTFGPSRSFQVMSVMASVPTTPTKASKGMPGPSPTSEIYNLYRPQSPDAVTAKPPSIEESYSKSQLSRFNLERSATISNDQIDHKDSPGSLSITSVAVTMSTVHDDEWYAPDETVQTSESTSNDGRSEDSWLRTPSIGMNQSKMTATKFKKFTGAERTMYSN